MSTLALVLALAACALSAAAQSTTGIVTSPINVNTKTATILAGTLTSGIAISVVTANPCDTTYRLVCTDTASCSGYALTFDITEGPTDYQFNFATSTGGASGHYTESCALVSKSSTLDHAVCHQSVALSAGGKTTQTKTVNTITATDLSYGQFPITAGGSYLAAATGTCKASGNAAAAATGVSQIYKVLVVPAAAAAIAAGGLL